MKLVITIIASVMFLGACSSDSNSDQPSSEDMKKAETGYSELSESQKEILCSVYSVTTEEALTEKMKESGDSPKEAQAKWNVLEREC